ncbi:MULTISPECIES: DinB family protein [Brachybacterium]|uniref:DinB family protein n=1 Tax=Brachybacterium TaxID=43668 RepID=UPI0007A48912|nr:MULTISPECIES: DinB family protein [Brachybacterium]
MTDTPGDARIEPPLLAAERESLDAWLEFHRATVLQKIEGLDAEQLCRRSVPPSTLSPLGIVRHLGVVEEYWLGEVLLGEERPDPYCSPENPDGDLLDGTPETALADVAVYRERVASARAAQAGWTDLDSPVHGLLGRRELNLRWILTHLIEEYARHAGHLDLLREAIDGRTGE